MISFIGLRTQEVEIKPTLSISLKPDTEVLDEVMVVAYGTAKKSSFTGSAATMRGDKIQKTQVSDVSKALEGAVAGVQIAASSGSPGTSASIRIRGIGSISSSQEPLIVVDGVPYEGSLNSISAQDIESLTVLKDAAANSMYGARGSNGVIIITTKGSKSGKARINFEARFGTNQRGVPTYDVMTDAGMYYETMFESYRNALEGNIEGDAAQYAAENLIAKILKYNKFKGVADNALINPTTGKLNPAAKEYKWNDDWTKDPFENGSRQEYNVNISGGTEKTQAYASLGYLEDEGYMVGSGFERISARVKVDQFIGKNFRVGGNMAYSNTVRRQFGSESGGTYSNIFMFSQNIAPVYPIYMYDKNGALMYDEKGNVRYDFGTEYTRPYAAEQNPYATAKENIYKYMADNLSTRGYFEAKFLNDFKFTLNVAYDVFNNTSTEFSTPIGGDAYNVGGRGYNYTSRRGALNLNQLLNWTREFGEHNFNVLLGHETKNDKYKYLEGHMTNFADPTNPDFSNATQYQGLTSYSAEYALEGYFAKLDYDYADKYYLTGSIRRDGSSRFHKDNRWGDFWSAGAAWVISKEDFFDVQWVDILKLKASYGEQGNDQIGNYRYTTLYEVKNSAGKPAAVPYSKGNKDISWETQGNFNAGIDFDLFKGRISGTIEYFNRKTSDMLFSFPLPPSQGYTSYYANIGDMNNRGLEIELRLTPIKVKDFEWNVNVNFTTYENTVSYLPKERKTALVDGKRGFTSGSYFYGEDCSLYTFHMKKYAGINEKGESMWYKNITKPINDAEGNQLKDEYGIPMVEILGRETTTKYNEASDYLCGTALPDAYGGFGTSFAWKGFDLSVDFSFQIGGQVYDSDYASMMGSPTSNSKGSNIHADMLKAWTASNNSNIPRMQFNDQYTAGTSDRFLTDASYLSLNNINFGYTFPKLWTKKVGVEKLRLYVAADNIWVWSKRQGLDPRQSITGSNTNSYYKPMRTISGGVTVTF